MTMREILFRGKEPDTGKWVYGGYGLYPHTRFPAKTTIYEVEERACWRPVEVIPETIGQYTGQKDKIGQRIFEGDIVVVDLGEQSCACLVGDVYFVNGVYMINHVSTALSLCAYRPYCTVIGNIHDDQELLGRCDNGSQAD